MKRLLLSISIFFGALLGAMALAAPNVPAPEKLPLIRTEKYDPSKERASKSAKYFFAGHFLKSAVSDPFVAELRGTLDSPDLAKYFPDRYEKRKIVEKATQGLKQFYDSPGEETLIKALTSATNVLTSAIVERVLTTEAEASEQRIEVWKKHLLAPMNQCLAKVKSFDQAQKCVNVYSSDIQKNIGLAITAELTIKKVVPSHPMKETDAPKIVLESTSAYAKCIQTKNAKIEDCVLSSMRESIAKTADLTIRTKLASIPREKLDPIRVKGMKTAEACLGKATEEPEFLSCIDTLTYSVSTEAAPLVIANHKALKAAVSKAEIPAFVKTGSETFTKCMNRQENNLRNPGDLDSDKCSLETENSVVYKIALNKMLTAVNDNTSPDSRERDFVTAKVKGKFESCAVDSAPLEKREACLRENVIFTTNLIFMTTVKRGATPKLRQSNWEKRFSLWNEKLTGCLDKSLPKNISTENIDPAIYGCIADTAGSVAAAEVEVATEPYLHHNAAGFGDRITKTSFVPCLKAAREVTGKVVDGCSSKLRTVVTKEVVAHELEEAGKAHYGSPTALDLAKQKLYTCVDSAKGSAEKIDSCTSETQKAVTTKVLFHVFRKEADDQVGPKKSAELLPEIEKDFQSCVAAIPSPPHKEDENAPVPLDKCMLKFIVDGADRVGTAKLDAVLKPMVGKSGYDKMAAENKKNLEVYRACLKNIHVYATEKITLEIILCGNTLEMNSVAALRRYIRGEMDKYVGNQKAGAVDELIALAIPCLDGLTGDSKPADDLQSVDPEGMLAGLLKLIGTYIRYDVDIAQRRVPEILSDLMQDLEMAGPVEARRKLVKSLADKGFLDQLLKQIVQDTLTEKLSAVPNEDRLPKAEEENLISKENLNVIFKGAAGEKLRAQIVKTVLEPVLVDQQDYSSFPVKTALSEVEHEVALTLLDSPQFGRRMAKLYAQKGIDDKANSYLGIPGVFISMIYGSEAKDWNKVRETESGKKAEAYIREKLLAPNFLSEKLSKEEEQKRRAEAATLVQAAMSEFAKMR